MQEFVRMDNTALNNRFVIAARYMDGVKVVGYHLIDVNKNGYAVDKETVGTLALAKVIVNCTAQRYKGEVVIKGVGCKLSDLPVFDMTNKRIRGEEANKKKKSSAGKYRIISRISQGKTTIGYELRDPSGAIKRASRNDVLRLARENMIDGVRAQLYNGVLILRGVGFELTQLPSKQIQGEVRAVAGV